MKPNDRVQVTARRAAPGAGRWSENVRLHHLILAAVLSSAAPAAGSAQEDVHVSPSKEYSIVNIGDSASGNMRFDIRATSGRSLFSCKEDFARALGYDSRFFNSHANNILWRADGKAVLFSVDCGKQKDTVIFYFPAQKLIRFGHVEDGYTLPVRWIASQRFVVEMSTPRGGKAFGGVHIWRQTYQIRTKPFDVECVYTGPTRVTEVVPYCPQ
jgi:hypothetical protein